MKTYAFIAQAIKNTDDIGESYAVRTIIVEAEAHHKALDVARPIFEGLEYDLIRISFPTEIVYLNGERIKQEG